MKTDALKIDANHRYGLPALFEELADQNVSKDRVLKEAGVLESRLRLTYQERLSIFRAAQNLAKKSGSGLLGGLRQRISSYGAYGYVMATSATFGDAIRIASSYGDLSGTVLRISLRVEHDVGIWRSHEPESLGPVLPFVAEFWRSSQVQLFQQILGRTFPSVHLSFPYPPPKHRHLYRDIFGCPVSFSSDAMEWRFDAAVLNEPCVDADPDVAKFCQDYCESFLRRSGVKSEFQRDVQRACIAGMSNGNMTAPVVAKALNRSVRTFYRQLEREGVNFQSLVDSVLRAVAVDYLANTELPVEEIAHRCGYQDASNFRKAFKRWTDGRMPSSFRER